MLKFGVIGYGYWGPNIVRNLRALEGCEVVGICDQTPAARKRIQAAHPGIPVHSDSHELARSADVDVVAVITPVWTHYELAKEALENGKHVFVEKPFTSTAAQAEELINLAEQKNLKIMVDHTFLFTGAVRKIQKVIKEGMLGKLYYYDSTRVNLGLFQHDCNVIWDLAPHDLSIMNHLLHKDAEAISATGQAHVNSFEDIAFITAYYPDKMIAHVNVNWISPVKVRTTLIGGEKKMLVWNDLEADEKLKIYDKGVDVKSQEGVYNLLVSYRTGDMWSPQVEQVEALKLELQYFVDCIKKNQTPINGGCEGLKVVRMLEAASQSLAKRGELVYV
jgi:predicted dehydrogenase